MQHCLTSSAGVSVEKSLSPDVVDGATLGTQ
jgi:hypothetical protein